MRCADVVAAFGMRDYHCESCHEDADAGEACCFLSDGDREIEVCCDVANALELAGITDAEVFDKLDAHERRNA